MTYGTHRSIICSGRGRYRIHEDGSGNSWDNFNTLWARALNLYEAGQVRYFAMIHSDIVCHEPGWLDSLLDELVERKADLISCAVAIKDQRGLTSCGLGDPADLWRPFRRLTVRELMAGRMAGSGVAIPETFTASDIGYPNHPLIHNNGLWVADLSADVFHQVDELGNLVAVFQFPKCIARQADGLWAAGGESEDWYFSRMLSQMGARTFITRKVKINHPVGTINFRNFEAWGTYRNGDEDTAHKWRVCDQAAA